MPMHPSPKADTFLSLWPSLRCCIDLSLLEFVLVPASNPAQWYAEAARLAADRFSPYSYLILDILRRFHCTLDEQLILRFRAFCVKLEWFFQSGCYGSAPRRQGGPAWKSFPWSLSVWWKRPRSQRRGPWAAATGTGPTRRRSKPCGTCWTPCR